MRAVVWKGPRKVSVETVDDPRLEEPTDALVRVAATAICGSDLHLFDHGVALAMKPGDVLGHETLGVVEEVGAEVSTIAPGDRVVVPFNISCGRCYLCRKGMYSQCETTQNLSGGKGGALFGYTHMYGGVAGGQAQYLRVPQAHFGPFRVPDHVPDTAAVLLADVLPTAWQAVRYADVTPGDTVAVFGLGPVGQMCVRIAKHQGAGVVVGVDPNPDRLALAEDWGATVVHAGERDAVEAVRDLTAGRGADGVVDAVGMDAEGSLVDKALQTLKAQPDRLVALHAAMGSVRRGGTLSVVGVYGGWFPAFPVGDLFDRQVTVRWGQANVRRWTEDLLATFDGGADPLGAAGLVTQEVPLEEAPAWYAKFRDKEPGVVKVVLRP